MVPQVNPVNSHTFHDAYRPAMVTKEAGIINLAQLFNPPVNDVCSCCPFRNSYQKTQKTLAATPVSGAVKEEYLEVHVLFANGGQSFLDIPFMS